MKNQQDKEERQLIKYPLDVKKVFVTEEAKDRLDYILGIHGNAARELLDRRLTGNDPHAGTGASSHDEIFLSVVLAGVSVEQLTSEVSLLDMVKRHVIKA